ncbi:inactive TPR repeat-containing thioredoxin TTL3-like isoform X1 [Nicotiana tabacum]|uniref:Inactive TPR repeat-containing thioredoxin TTL3-like isoform X1 n=1 Tax=Nicotiana tabacum TaxID=4097 RepID=A0A1S4A0L4_TOBAC|nr:PREDICTED: inactive TPR repeat-containing thioredoxin TTL3-like isoform X1 [Nicotiana tabacum]
MAEIAERSVEIQLGCGLMAAIFQLGKSKPSKQPVPPLPTKSSANDLTPIRPSITYLDAKKSAKNPRKLGVKHSTQPLSITPRNSISHDQKHVRRSTSDGTRISSKQSSTFSSSHKMSQVVNLANTKKPRREPTFTPSDLTATGALNRASSTGNIMLLGQLGNLKQQKNQNGSSDQKTIGRVVLMGNIVKQPSIRSHMLNKLDPDVLKCMGNEHYRNGRFEEAMALYDQAISINPRNACYYSNKSAALMSLGRLMEAVIECREAIRLDPFYHNAQSRLARLYLRLGEAEKAIDHYKQCGRKVERRDIAEAQDLKRSICNCIEAHKLRDYSTLLKESQNAMSFGADSAPQIIAMRAEALMKLQRHEEAYITIQKGPNFETELCTCLFGSTKTAYLLIIRAQVYTLVGRFDDGIAAAQEAAKLDLSNEITKILRRIKGLASARLKGNDLFKESKYTDACSIYTQGLEQEQYNSVLLFNRAACRFKLGQFEKAVEDCTAALVLRSSYLKARFKRADCYMKLERWEAAIQDYEILLQEKPGNEEVKRAYLDAKIQLERERNEDQKQRKLSNGSNLVLVTSN